MYNYNSDEAKKEYLWLTWWYLDASKLYKNTNRMNQRPLNMGWLGHEEIKVWQSSGGAHQDCASTKPAQKTHA